MAELTMIAPHEGLQLSARAANVARAVADVLERCGSTESEADETATFLRDWASSVPIDVGAAASPFDRLADRFDFTEDECDLILLSGLPHEHEGIATMFRSIHPQGEPHPTVGLAALLKGGSCADRARLRLVLTTGAAVRGGLLAVGSGSFFECSLILAGSLWNALHGCDAWPTDLVRVEVGGPPAGLDGWLAGNVARTATRILGGDHRAVVLVTSDDEDIGRARCSALAAAAGRDVVASRFDSADSRRVALLTAHAAVRGAIPMLVVPPADTGVPVPLPVSDVPGAIIVCAAPGTVKPPADRAVLAVSAEPVDALDQQVAWRAAVPALATQASALAARHALDPAITAQVAVDVEVHHAGVDIADVTRLINTRTAASLPVGAQLLTPNVPWSHIVLPAESGLQLRDAVARLDHQGTVLDAWGLGERAHARRGGRLLFTGAPGTGKSLAAAAVATAAHTGLLIIDVSRIVSRWLGETEKNLAATFEAAERTQAVLLLDEADALFAKRTEVTDAHDRYANLETAYLLQRLDRFDGLTILTTNLRANIDPAFIRRMDFVVEFPLPDELGRRELWSRHLPGPALADDVDIDGLARLYPVPGGWIRNAALAAAFGAAAAHDRITQLHIVAAMRREYAKASVSFPGEPPRRRHDPV